MLCKGVQHANFRRSSNIRGLRDGWLARLGLKAEIVTQEEVRRRIREGMRHHVSDTQTNVQLYATMLAVQTALAMSTVDLVQATFAPSPTLVIGDLTIATFTGYTQVSNATVPAPFYDLVNGGVSIAVPATFTCTGTAIGNTIYGYVLQTAVPAIVQTGLFEEQLTVNMNHQAIPISILVNAN